MQQNCLRVIVIGRCDAYISSGTVSMGYSVAIVSHSLPVLSYSSSVAALTGADVSYVWLVVHATTRAHLYLSVGAQTRVRSARAFSAQRHSLKGHGPQQCMQRRVRRQTATVAFWGGGDDKRPSSKNVLDTTMAWGDILTLLATELVMSFSPHISSVDNQLYQP